MPGALPAGLGPLYLGLVTDRYAVAVPQMGGRMSRCILRQSALALLFVFAAAPLLAQEAAYESPDATSMIHDALSAATPEMAKGAAVVDWDQNVLKEGTNGWTCFPTPPQFEKAPMCFDDQWMSWADAWMNKRPVDIDGIGIAYMLAGDSGGSNSDPYAEGETDDWIVSGPHLMVIAPNTATLEGITTDPKSGGPWVMWKDTPYAHIMVPVATGGGHDMCAMCKEMHGEGHEMCEKCKEMHEGHMKCEGENCPHKEHKMDQCQ